LGVSRLASDCSARNSSAVVVVLYGSSESGHPTSPKRRYEKGSKVPTLIQIVKEQFEAFRRKDLDSFMEIYTDDTVVKNFVGEILYQGKEVLREGNRHFLDTNPKSK
jgi:hypothetical protein